MNAKTEATTALDADTNTAKASSRGEAAGIVKRTSAYFADPKTIARKVDPETGERFNPRFDFGDIEALAKSIKANGVLNLLRVKRIAPTAEGHVFELIDGERRLTAIEFILKKDPAFFAATGVPVVIVDKAQTDMTSLIQMFEANNSKTFTPLEEAHAYKRMQEAGMSVKEICAAVGHVNRHVTEVLAILDADDTLIEAAEKGTIGKTMAKNIAAQAAGDKAKQAELTKAAVAAGTNKAAVRAVKKSIDAARQARQTKAGKALKIRALDDAALSELGSSVAATMTEKMKDAGKALNFDLLKWIKADETLALAAAFGALQALKAAAGQKIDLDF